MKISDNTMEIAAEIAAELMNRDIREISNLIMNQSDEHFKELSKKLDKIFDEYAIRQENGEFGPVSYVNFTYLYSSVLTESFDVLIYLSDSKQYLGVNDVHITWKPMFIMDYYLKSKSLYERYLYEKIIGIKKSEVHEMMVLFGWQYYRFIYTFLSVRVPDILALASYQRMLVTEEVEITFGALYGDYDILNLFDGLDLEELAKGDEEI